MIFKASRRVSQKIFTPNIIWRKPHPNPLSNNGEGLKSPSPHCWGEGFREWADAARVEPCQIIFRTVFF